MHCLNCNAGAEARKMKWETIMIFCKNRKCGEWELIEVGKQPDRFTPLEYEPCQCLHFGSHDMNCSLLAARAEEFEQAKRSKK